MKVLTFFIRFAVQVHAYVYVEVYATYYATLLDMDNTGQYVLLLPGRRPYGMIYHCGVVTTFIIHDVQRFTQTVIALP